MPLGYWLTIHLKKIMAKEKKKQLMFCAPYIDH